MIRLAHMVSAVVLVSMQVLPLAGGGKDNADPLIVEMKFVKVPKGTFWMGWNKGVQSKQAEVKEDFELAAYTVTQAQWQAIMGNNPSRFSRNGAEKAKVKDVADEDLKRFPVENVSWDDVQVFLKKLNTREKGKGWLYRLPTEIEWEYACRNATTTKEECSFYFYFDKATNDLSSKEANFWGMYPEGNAGKGPYLARPTKVGSYAPNKLGLYDMHGNVWQWCDNTWTPKHTARTIRGGAWGETAIVCNAANRNLDGPTWRSPFTGFRVARFATGAK